MPLRPDFSAIGVLPADWSAVTLTVLGAETAIGRSATGRRSVVAPLVSVSAPNAYCSSVADVVVPEIVSCCVAPGPMSNALGDTAASKPGALSDTVQCRAAASTEVNVRVVEKAPATLPFATSGRLRSAAGSGVCPSLVIVGSSESM